MWESDNLAGLIEPALVKIFRYLRRGMTEEARKHQLTFTQATALRFLVASGPMRMNELAGMLELSGSACTTMIDQLQKRGLVEKRLDEDDRRATRVGCTSEGHALARQILTSIYRGLAQDMQHLSVAERYMVVGGLEALASVVEGERAETEAL